MLISGKKWTLSCLKWVIFKIQLSRLICRNEWKSIMITSKILKNYSFSFDSWKHGSVFFLSFHQDDSSYSQILHLKIMIISEIYSIDLTEPYCWFFFSKGSDTVASALSWAIYLIGSHSDIQVNLFSRSGWLVLFITRYSNEMNQCLSNDFTNVKKNSAGENLRRTLFSFWHIPAKSYDEWYCKAKILGKCDKRELKTISIRSCNLEKTIWGYFAEWWVIRRVYSVYT